MDGSHSARLSGRGEARLRKGRPVWPCLVLGLVVGAAGPVRSAEPAAPAPPCAAAASHELPLPQLQSALEQCFREHGNHLRLGDREFDRGTALQWLHVEPDARRRKAIFGAFAPLWAALNADGSVASPYRRMIVLRAQFEKTQGSQLQSAAVALGVPPAEIEQWLVRILEAWRKTLTGPPVEPWDYRYVGGKANRKLAPATAQDTLLPVTRRFFRDLGADVDQLQVQFDLEPAPNKSPLAYTDFRSRGRQTATGWQRPTAVVVGLYPEGGLFAMNELVHETGHAVHVSAIHTDPAHMDWPDTLFVEAFADVPSWSTYEPVWQQRYLGRAVSERDAQRALFSDVMLDVAWALFEIRLLRDPGLDPNVVWTEITMQYLNVKPHPELPWWAMRVQLVAEPGYMLNYGLGAVLTAEMRAATRAQIGAFDSGNLRWYGWLSDRLLQFGTLRSTQMLLQELLGRPVNPEPLLQQVARCGAPRKSDTTRTRRSAESL